MVRVLILLALLGACASARGQGVPADSVRAESARTDSARVGPASAVADTTRPGATGVPLAAPAEGGLDEPVTYTARDSVRIELATRDAPPDSSDAPGGAPDDVVTLYGDAEATYQTATISAALLQYSAGAQTLRAEPAASDSGDVGVPSFTDGEETFTGRLFTYNLATRRGRVTGARTRIEDGFLLGGVIKQADAHVIYAENAAYTTCELDHPHYSLEAGRLKIVDGRRVYTGPVRLRLLGLAVPVVLPFGYFPAAQGRRSGPLPFRYGQETGYGLFLDNVGWYWAVSDFFDATASGKIGTEGSFLARGAVRYNRLYAYTGELRVETGRLRQGESTDPGYAPRVPTSVQWSHRQTFAAGPTLGASVNLISTSQRLVADAVSQQIQQSTSSSVQFQQAWPSVGRQVSVDVQAYQDFVGNRTTLTLPTLGFTQQRLFPFRRGRDDSALDKVALSYSARATNTLAFSPLSDSTGVGFFDALFDAAAFETATGQPSRFDTRVEQSVPVQANFAVSRFNLSVTPSLQFTEIWAGRTTERTFLSDSNAVLTRQVAGFETARRLRADVTASTEVFGTFGLRVGPVDGVRHTVRPRVSLSFEPDYQALGYVREVQTDTTGRTLRYSPVSGIPTEPTRTLGFGVDNAVLVRLARADSTGEVQRRSVQVLSLDVQGGVNFAAPERPVQDLSFSATSQIFGASARASGGFSAYALDDVGNLTTDSYLSADGRPLRLTSVSGTVSRTFGGRSQGAFGGVPAGDVRPVLATRPPGEAYDPAFEAPRSAVVGYLDAAAPLSFALDFTAFYTPAVGAAPSRTTATLSVNQFNLRLTPNWTATGSTGLDLVTLDPTTTSVALRRDLHCWEMAVQWQPIGLTRGFSVSLYVKSGYLRDFLRLDVPRNVVRSLPF